MPDHLYIRYGATPGFDDTLWIEFKRFGKEPKRHQAKWHSAETLRGATVLVVDGIDKFISWYAESGWCRKVNLRARK